MRNILAAGAPPLRLVLRQPNQRAQLARSFRRHQSSKPDRTDPNKVTPDDPPTVVPDAPAPAPLPLWQRLGPLTTAMTAYGRAQRRRPWGTQFVSALVIYCLADLSAQNISSDDPIDPVRNLRSMFIGGLSAIPTYLW